MNLSLAVNGTYLTLEASPNTAAATERHPSTSIPDQLPAESGAENQVTPVVTPQ